MIFTNIYFLPKLILTDGKLPNSINHKMTNGQHEINHYISRHFCEEFLEEEYLSQFNNQDDAREGFDRDFEYRYNSDEGFDCDLGHIRSECDFLTTMKICEAVVCNYNEDGMRIEDNAFEEGGEGLLKMYIYFYLKDCWYDYMMERITEYPFEEEPEPELPPAQ
tara:strand:+ start:22 stop:513 length:492 start_codon:yes stop_codon:yes gene_type:complete